MHHLHLWFDNNLLSMKNAVKTNELQHSQRTIIINDSITTTTTTSSIKSFIKCMIIPQKITRDRDMAKHLPFF